MASSALSSGSNEARRKAAASRSLPPTRNSVHWPRKPSPSSQKAALPLCRFSPVGRSWRLGRRRRLALSTTHPVPGVRSRRQFKRPSAAGGDAPPWPLSGRLVCAVLQEFPSLADRVAVVERLGSHHLAPVQFVDDLTVPCPSEGCVYAILADAPRSACSRFALRFQARFSYARNKTCVLPVLDAPPRLAADYPSVAKKHLLGILVDTDLSFRSAVT